MNTPSQFSAVNRTLLCISLACAPGCGKESQPTAGGKTTGEVEEAPLGHPASPAEAAKFLDLTTFPLMPGKPETRHRTLANLSCRAKSDVKAAYDFQKKNLEAMKWRESPGSAVTAEYASGTFTRSGFVVSVMVSPSGEPGTVEVLLHNQGNVDLGKLPLPPGTKPVYVGPLSAMHVTEAAIATTRDECRKLLTAAGWQPFGGAGDSVYYKQNAILLTATVCAAPAQDAKTMISYGSEQMSADIPAMPGAEGLRYTDTTGRLDFDTASTEEDVSQFYHKTLAVGGWAPTMDHIVKVDGGRDFVVFRSPAKEALTLEMQKLPEGKTRVSLFHQSEAALAEEERRSKAQLAARTAKLKAELEKPVLVVPLPADATVISQTKNEIKLTVSAGSSSPFLRSLDKLYGETGWLMSDTRQGGVGVHGFKREGQTLTIDFSDTGAGPAEMTITSTGVGLEVAKADKPKPMPKVAVVLPAGAAGVEHRGSQMKFTVGTGKAKATVEAMQKQFLDAGWKPLAPSLDGDYGNISFTKGDMRVGINYVDTGTPSARIEMSVVGAEFERPGGQ